MMSGKEFKIKKSTPGRWSQVEHDKFMRGLEKYGKNWSAIQRRIKTRTITQIRSHAQKVFAKMDQRDIDDLININQEEES